MTSKSQQNKNEPVFTNAMLVKSISEIEAAFEKTGLVLSPRRKAEIITRAFIENPKDSVPFREIYGRVMKMLSDRTDRTEVSA